MAVAVLALAIGQPARAASASASVAVSASVLARTVVRVESSASELVITDADVRRGYVDFPSAVRFQVTSNDPNGYLLVFELAPDIVKSVVVRGLGAEAQILMACGWIPQPYAGGQGTISELSYRLVLSDTVRPGSYGWPVSVSVDSR